MRFTILASVFLALATLAPGQAGFPLTARVWSVDYSPDGTRIAATQGPKGAPGRFAIWNTETGDRVFERSFDAPVGPVAYSPDGRHLAVTAGNLVYLVEPDTGKPLTEFAHPKAARAVAFGPPGKVATSCDDGVQRIWDITTRKELLRTPERRYPMVHLAYSRDGKRLAGADDQKVSTWDATSGKELLTLPALDRTNRWAVAFSVDGAWLLRTSIDRGTLLVHDAATGAVRVRFENVIGSVAIRPAPEGFRVASSGYWGDNTELYYLPLRLTPPSPEGQNRIDQLLRQLDHDDIRQREAAVTAFYEMGTIAEPALARAMKESPSAEVRLRARLARTEILHRHAAIVPLNPPKPGGSSGIPSLAVSPEGKFLALGCLDGIVRIIDNPGGKTVRELHFGEK